VIEDLEGGRRPQRLLAARELRRQVRRAIRESWAPEGSITADEAMQAMQWFDDNLAPLCADVVLEEEPVLVRNCARVLGMLETRAALAQLQQASARPQGWRQSRALRRAIGQIEEAR
jgi:hypothetical protein